MPRVQLWGWECNRCGHTWVPREDSTEEPRVCPRCKSPYWNKERKRPVRTGVASANRTSGASEKPPAKSGKPRKG